MTRAGILVTKWQNGFMNSGKLYSYLHRSFFLSSSFDCGSRRERYNVVIGDLRLDVSGLIHGLGVKWAKSTQEYFILN
jgi:hypothetical protein